MKSSNKQKGKTGLIWVIALLLPLPSLILGDFVLESLSYRPLEVDLLLMRPVILLPGLILLIACIRGYRIERWAHAAVYILVGLLALPWYLGLVRTISQ